MRLLRSGLSRAKVAKAVYSVTCCSHQHLAGYAVTTTTTTWAGCPFEAIAPIWLQPEGSTFSMANSHSAWVGFLMVLSCSFVFFHFQRSRILVALLPHGASAGSQCGLPMLGARAGAAGLRFSSKIRLPLPLQDTI